MGCTDILSTLCGSSARKRPQWERWDNHPINDDYEVVRQLGRGSFSEIVLARHKETKHFVALKVIFLKNPALYSNDETKGLLIQEASLLTSLNHPNIVRCTRVVQGLNVLILVLEYLKGGNVLDRLYALSHVYTERDAAGVFEQLVTGVAHLHKNNILHRDIKPENVMYAKEPVPDEPIPTVKLVDLGLAYKYNPDILEKGILGSAGFVAPEVIRGGKHTRAMDVYGLGVLLFIMLVGRKPFNNTENENLKYAYKKLQNAPGLRDPRWLDLSPDAKDLLMGMLTFSPERRLTAAQVLQHEWIVSKGGITVRPLGQDVALAAAAVADLRRLRNMCGATVALGRAVQATSAQRLAAASRNSGERRRTRSDTIDAALVDELERTAKVNKAAADTKTAIVYTRDSPMLTSAILEAPPSTRHNGPIDAQLAIIRTSLDGAENKLTPEHLAYLEKRKAHNTTKSMDLARRIAARSFVQIHDSSTTTVSGNKTENADQNGDAGGEQDFSSSYRRRLEARNGGMRRSATAVMLSQLAASDSMPLAPDRSVGGGRSFGRLSFLLASVAHFVDTSVKKGMGRTGYQYAPSAEAQPSPPSSTGSPMSPKEPPPKNSKKKKDLLPIAVDPKESYVL